MAIDDLKIGDVFRGIRGPLDLPLGLTEGKMLARVSAEARDLELPESEADLLKVIEGVRLGIRKIGRKKGLFADTGNNCSVELKSIRSKHGLSVCRPGLARVTDDVQREIRERFPSFCVDVSSSGNGGRGGYGRLPDPSRLPNSRLNWLGRDRAAAPRQQIPERAPYSFDQLMRDVIAADPHCAIMLDQVILNWKGSANAARALKIQIEGLANKTFSSVIHIPATTVDPPSCVVYSSMPADQAVLEQVFGQVYDFAEQTLGGNNSDSRMLNLRTQRARSVKPSASLKLTARFRPKGEIQLMYGITG